MFREIFDTMNRTAESTQDIERQTDAIRQAREELEGDLRELDDAAPSPPESINLKPTRDAAIEAVETAATATYSLYSYLPTSAEHEKERVAWTLVVLAGQLIDNAPAERRKRIAGNLREAADDLERHL